MPHLAVSLAAAALARLFLNTARRFPYPFASSLARGLGVPLEQVTSLIALSQTSSLASLALGPLIDRIGTRVMMLAGLAVLAAGMLGAGLIGVYGAVAVGLLLAGIASACFDPSLFAFAGQRVPYARRGLAIGFIELAWAGSSLIGIPLAGLLIVRLGWHAPFIALGAVAILAAMVLALVLPRDEIPPADGPRRGVAQAWIAVGRSPAARAGLGYAFLFGMANDTLFVVYGSWLEQRFGLSVLAIGTATTVIGAAELAGDCLTAAIADKVGLGRAALGGLILTTIGCAVLPLVGQTLPLALAALFVTFLAFEFTIVTGFSLFTETLPGSRATMMSGISAGMSLGRACGALTGGPVWLAGGLGATALACATLTLLAGWCLAASLRAGARARRGAIGGADPAAV